METEKRLTIQDVFRDIQYHTGLDVIPFWEGRVNVALSNGDYKGVTCKQDMHDLVTLMHDNSLTIKDAEFIPFTEQ